MATPAPVRAEQAYNDAYCVALAEFPGGPPPVWDDLLPEEQEAYAQMVRRVRYLDREEA